MKEKHTTILFSIHFIHYPLKILSKYTHCAQVKLRIGKLLKYPPKKYITNPLDNHIKLMNYENSHKKHL